MKQQYIDSNLRGSSLALIAQANTIIDEYDTRLTVRQLYYQLVSRNFIENTVKSYKRVVKVITEGRLAGLLDWDSIEDRARSFERRQHWLNGKQVMDAASRSFHMDMWETQPTRVFVLIEKDALSGVLSTLCHKWDTPLLACKGYPSASVLREFAINDIIPALYALDQRVTVLHLGDHDPSGIDMTRDLAERIELFTERPDPQVIRLALNMPQIEKLKPPPNPAKQSDSRYARYVRKFGRKCWELDALPPDELQAVVERSIRGRIDWDKWHRREREIEATKKRIRKHAMKFKG